MALLGDRAVIIGGSIGGLMTARVLSDHLNLVKNYDQAIKAVQRQKGR